MKLVALTGALRRLAWLGLGLAALVVAAGMAYAATPSGNGTINGCYDKVNGQLRMIDPESGAGCHPSELPISWSVQGPQGPKGDPGSLSVVLRESRRQVTLAPGASTTIAVQCQSGEVAMSGSSPSSFPQITVEASTFFWDGINPSGWLVAYRNDDTVTRTQTFEVLALCAAGVLSLG